MSLTPGYVCTHIQTSADMADICGDMFLLILQSGQAHRVSQFQVVNWDRNGIAFNKMAVLTIMNYTTKLQQQKNSNSNGPVVVHCR